jgi:hypothetical protein
VGALRGRPLSSAQKLRPRGHARSIYLRSINGYGMPKQPTPELDDFYAFTVDDLGITGYETHEQIKNIPVAV